MAEKKEKRYVSDNAQLVKEWDWEKNNQLGLLPDELTCGSGKKAWWKCSKGHEWEAIIQSRTRGNGCPICNSERNTSFPEYMLMYYLKKYGVEVIHSYKAHGYELDVYIPSKKIAIEYDGYFWHKNKTEKDIIKNSKCRHDGITLYRIREGLPSLNDSSIDYTVQKNQRDLPQVMELIISEIIGTNIYVDLEKDAIDIENLREHTEKENSLFFSNPNLASEWNCERNGNIIPENFLPNSNKKVWWKCKNGHEWQATISTRNKGIGCPYCSGQKVLKGFNDLQSVNPNLANEWNYEKNGELCPNAVTKSNGKKVWWKCENGHEWQATIAHRSNGQGCPYCSGKYATKGKNDLLTINPNLVSEWNYERNGNLTPNDVLPNSNKKVWWRCNKGHEWQAKIRDRHKGKGCPYCSGRRATKGENDLLTVNFNLASEWNYKRNGDLTPNDVLPNSGKKVWWKCNKGHEWQARIQDRTKGKRCPYCAGRLAIKGVNDLQTINPHLACEWNYERNGDLTPNDVLANSGKKVWWRCKIGHEWQARIQSRNRGCGCPECSKKKRKKSE